MYNAGMDPIKAMTLRAKHEASHAIYAYHLKCSLPDLTIEDGACTFIERMGFDLDIPVEFSWYVVSPKTEQPNSSVHDFTQWLLTEAGQADRKI